MVNAVAQDDCDAHVPIDHVVQPARHPRESEKEIVGGETRVPTCLEVLFQGVQRCA
jgi:hypothetical protein